MDYRHSSPSTRSRSRRLALYREKSNSVPYGGDSLGCSTPEAELILREGKVAIRNRRRARRSLERDDDVYRPQDHIRYLQSIPTPLENPILDQSPATGRIYSQHCRMPSDVTDRTTSTLKTPVEPLEPDHLTKEPRLNVDVAGYSAGLAKFIQDQLSLIPTYEHTPSIPSARSCPELTHTPRTPQLLPTEAVCQPIGAPMVIDIPPIRPPMVSQFSAWSSTDDEDDELASMIDVDVHTPPLPNFYAADANQTSFFLPITPVEDEEEDDPETARASFFPNQANLLRPSNNTSSSCPEVHSSSAASSGPQLSSSFGPSTSSASTDSYFECKRPISLSAEIQDRIQKAITPLYNPSHVIQATSPFEGAALANVHDVVVQSQKKVFVDGMSFDMLRNFLLPTKF